MACIGALPSHLFLEHLLNSWVIAHRLSTLQLLRIINFYLFEQHILVRLSLKHIIDLYELLLWLRKVFVKLILLQMGLGRRCFLLSEEIFTVVLGILVFIDFKWRVIKVHSVIRLLVVLDRLLLHFLLLNEIFKLNHLLIFLLTESTLPLRHINGLSTYSKFLSSRVLNQSLPRFLPKR